VTGHTYVADALRRLASRLGIDFHVAYALVSKLWMVIAGAGTVILIPRYLSETSQGYYYTFSAILGVLVFFELGLNQVIAQIAAHDAAHIERDKAGRLLSGERGLARLRALLHFIYTWSRWAATLFVLAILPLGVMFFQRHGVLPIIEWIKPWAILVLFAAANLFQASRLAFMEGLGLVGQIARLRLAQSMIGYLTMWVVLITTKSLYAAVVVPAISAIGTALWLRFSDNPIRGLMATSSNAGACLISWREEILPLQWRIALSWISSFFIYQAFVPMAFASQGAAEAGQLGLGLNVFTAITTVAMSWVMSRSPRFATLVAQQQRDELRATFRHAFRHSFAAIVLLVVMVILAIWLVNVLDWQIARRVPSLGVTAALGCAAIGNSAIFAMANFMHAHKQDPLAIPSAVTAILVIFAAYYGMQVSVLAAIAAYAAIICLLFVPWTFTLFRQYYGR